MKKAILLILSAFLIYGCGDVRQETLTSDPKVLAKVVKSVNEDETLRTKKKQFINAHLEVLANQNVFEKLGEKLGVLLGADDGRKELDEALGKNSKKQTFSEFIDSVSVVYDEQNALFHKKAMIRAYMDTVSLKIEVLGIVPTVINSPFARVKYTMPKFPEYVLEIIVVTTYSEQGFSILTDETVLSTSNPEKENYFNPSLGYEYFSKYKIPSRNWYDSDRYRKEIFTKGEWEVNVKMAKVSGFEFDYIFTSKYEEDDERGFLDSFITEFSWDYYDAEAVNI